MRKKIKIAIKDPEEAIKEVVDDCHKAERGEPSEEPVHRVYFQDLKTPKEACARQRNLLDGGLDLGSHGNIRARRDELYEREQQPPNPHDWTIEDVVTVAVEHGLEVTSTGGSHYTFSHRDVDFHLTIPAGKPIKPVHIKDLVRFIDAVTEKQNEKS